MPMTADTRDLAAAAGRCIRAAWRDGFSYVKAGVILDDLRVAVEAPPLLFGEPLIGSDALMRAVDAINHRFGRGTIYPAAAGIARAWGQWPARVSPRYTTRLDELPTVRA
jgi:DNA polymerase V